MVWSDIKENVNKVKGQGHGFNSVNFFSYFIITDFTSSLTRCMTLVTITILIDFDLSLYVKTLMKEVGVSWQ